MYTASLGCFAELLWCCFRCEGLLALGSRVETGVLLMIPWIFVWFYSYLSVLPFGLFSLLWECACLLGFELDVYFSDCKLILLCDIALSCLFVLQCGSVAVLGFDSGLSWGGWYICTFKYLISGLGFWLVCLGCGCVGL